jgi:hypothetical protein
MGQAPQPSRLVRRPGDCLNFRCRDGRPPLSRPQAAAQTGDAQPRKRSRLRIDVAAASVLATHAEPNDAGRPGTPNVAILHHLRASGAFADCRYEDLVLLAAGGFAARLERAQFCLTRRRSRTWRSGRARWPRDPGLAAVALRARRTSRPRFAAYALRSGRALLTRFALRTRGARRPSRSGRTLGARRTLRAGRPLGASWAGGSLRRFGATPKQQHDGQDNKARCAHSDPPAWHSANRRERRSTCSDYRCRVAIATQCLDRRRFR